MYGIILAAILIFLCYNEKCRDLSNNRLTGEVPDNGSFSLFTPIRFIPDAQVSLLHWTHYLELFRKSVFSIFCSFANNMGLCGPVTGRPCPGSPPFSPPPPFVPPPPISTPGDLYVETSHFEVSVFIL